MTARVEIDEVQANVLHGYGKEFGHALQIRVALGDSGSARRTVARWLRSVSFGNAKARPQQATHVNVALGPQGLAALGVPQDVRDAFPEDFRAGASKRAPQLGDRWTRPEDEDAHVLLSIYGRRRESCDALASSLLPAGPWAGRGLKVLSRRPTSFDNGGVEEFGFADGRSQPAIEGVDVHAVGDGVYVKLARKGDGLLQGLGAAAESLGLKRSTRGWRPIRAGEFLLGYENEDGVLPPAPPAPLGPNGTYMVYRELDQDRECFEAYLADQAKAHGIDEDRLGAKIVGRWKDGTPVAQIREPDIAPNRRRENDFRYEDDREGLGCPLGAHVRRANPRDGLPGGAESTMRHRIIRRGMPYDGGLAFICFSASIANGFEFIQREWINGGRAFGLDGPDFLLQQPDANARLSGKMIIPGYRTIVLRPPTKPFVTVRGCDYLFVPSRRACAWLAALAEAR